MNYERGLTTLSRLGKDTSWHQDFTLQEARLRENLDKMRRFGDNPSRQSDRAEIVDALNALAIAQLGVSFNDLCSDQGPPDQLVAAPPVAARPTGANYADGDRDHKKKLLNAYQERLQILELQQAQFGYAVPAHIVTEIKSLRNQIDDLKQQITPP